jgi:alkylation response protein AidB-like acyl-CoA dehydrogenase
MEKDLNPGNPAGLTQEEILHYTDLARTFAKKSVASLFGGEYPDGDLSRLPAVLDTAFAIGLAASPDRSLPGSQYGIWGSALDELGPAPSLLLLSTVAEACGGVAMCLHAQGVASNLALRAKGPSAPARVRLCLQEGPYPPSAAVLEAPAEHVPARIETVAAEERGRYVIRGAKSFSYAMEGATANVVLARLGERWACFLVPSGDARITVTDAGKRTGLRACRLDHVAFDGVEVPREARIDEGDAGALAARALFLNWAGMSAIAAGIARGAVAAARAYADERYQGGALIREHAAVKMLIAGAAAAADAAGAAVMALADCGIGSRAGLARAAGTKLSVTELAARAVTDSLQVFGGYGYMEDFGMEKRLRDMAVLRSAGGPPTCLKQALFDFAGEDA